ncbi:MAG TPA: radical SAM protein [Chloroflexia bacterium]|nr:radical SAM protein [Chloroflexia bacterium]
MGRLATLQHKLSTRLFVEDALRSDGYCRFAPEWLIFCINNFCNLKCRMCDVGIGERASVFYANMIGDNPGNMTLDLFKTALDGAMAFRPLPKVGLAFTEPLNHVHILDFCRETVERGFFCSITSNGFLLPQRAEALVDIGVDEIVISIDGAPEVHDRIRGRKGSFERLYKGITLLNEARERTGRKKPRVRISSTINDLNYGELRAALEAIAPLRPDSVNFAHLSFITDRSASMHNAIYTGEYSVAHSCLGEMDLGSIDLEVLGREIASVKELGSRIEQPVTFHPDLTTPEQLVRYYREPESYIGGKRCTDPFKMMMVKTDGSVIPAHSRCYNYPLGQVQDAPLTRIWNNARYVAFRSLLHDAGGSLPACTRCCGVVGKPG